MKQIDKIKFCYLQNKTLNNQYTKNKSQSSAVEPYS